MDLYARSANFGPSNKAPTEWQNSTSRNLQVAHRAHRAAGDTWEMSRDARDAAHKNNVYEYQNVQTHFAQKVDTSRRLAGLLQERIASVIHSINLSKQNWAALHAGHQAKLRPLQLCVWRQEQRSSRPDRELVRDACEIALEDEKDILLNGRGRLQQLIDKTERMLSYLKKILQDLQTDLQNKQSAVAIDSQCMDTLHPTWPSGGHITQLESSLEKLATRYGVGLPSSHVQFRDPGLANGLTERQMERENSLREEKRQQDTLQLIKHAKDTEHAALKLREESDKSIQKMDSDVKYARNQVENNLMKRISETQGLCQKLEQSVAQTNRSIAQMHMSNSMTQALVQAHKDPADLLVTRSKWREHRTTRENIGDPVTSSMDRQEMRLRRNLQDMQGVGQTETGRIDDLKRTKAMLEADIRDKLAALKIDMRCKEETWLGEGKGKSERDTSFIYESVAPPTPTESSSFSSRAKYSDSVRSRPRSAPHRRTYSSRPV